MNLDDIKPSSVLYLQLNIFEQLLLGWVGGGYVHTHQKQERASTTHRPELIGEKESAYSTNMHMRGGEYGRGAVDKKAQKTFVWLCFLHFYLWNRKSVGTKLFFFFLFIHPVLLAHTVGRWQRRRRVEEIWAAAVSSSSFVCSVQIGFCRSGKVAVVDDDFSSAARPSGLKRLAVLVVARSREYFLTSAAVRIWYFLDFSSRV